MKLNVLFTALCMILAFNFATAQEKKGLEFPGLDKSPMDAAHYPAESAYTNYLDEDDPKRTPIVKVLYSRPYKKGRKVFGELQKFGEEWRVGANECNEITFYRDVVIDGNVIPRGTYSMFADLHADHWMLKFSKQLFIAGTRDRDKTQDFVTTKVMTSNTSSEVEQFTIGFQKIDEGMVHLIMQWDNTEVQVPINLNAPNLAGEDKSPMDLAYYPARSKYQNFLKPEEVDANQPKMRVTYSRPQMNGRKVFGELLKYGEMWRLGANQTTLITFYENVNIGGTDIRRGTYGLFAKVNEGNWEIIVHTNTRSWGTFKHDDEDNVVTITAPTAKTPTTLEALSVTFEDKGNKAVDVIFGWEDTMARLPVTFK